MSPILDWSWYFTDNNALNGVDNMNGVRLANIVDVRAMSLIHARTWRSAYSQYISAEYLNNITDEGWIPLFTRAFKENLHEAAVFELDGKITGTVTFGRGRPMTTCTTGDTGENDKKLSCSDEETKPENNCCCNSNCCEEGEIISLYVLPQYWSTKQGYELTKFAVESLKKQCYKSCYLLVIKNNERAINFYKKFGFKSTSEFTSVMLAGKAVVEEKYRIYF